MNFTRDHGVRVPGRSSDSTVSCSGDGPELRQRVPNGNQVGSYIYIDSDDSELDQNPSRSYSTPALSDSSSSIPMIAPESRTQLSQSSLLTALMRLSDEWSTGQVAATSEPEVTLTRGSASHVDGQSQNCRTVGLGPSQVVSGTKSRDSLSGHDLVPGVTTTLMIRNIPLRYTPPSFRDLIDKEGFSGRYDYLYMPMDFRSQRSLGYCFINFYDPTFAQQFARTFSNRMFPSTNSDKVLAISAAARQGLLANVASFKQSTLKQMPKSEFKPLVGILGQLVPLDERVYSWLQSGSDDNPPLVQGLSSLLDLSTDLSRS